jgi:hypothetical protein
MTKSQKIINTTCVTNTPDTDGLVRGCRSQQRSFLAVALVFRLGNFSHDTFQLDIELVDKRLLLRIVASDVDGLRGKVAARIFMLFFSVSMRRVACRTRQGTQSDRLRSHSYVKEHSSDVAEDKMRWGISGDMAGSNEREPIQLRAHRRSHDQSREIQMTKMKTLSAVIILSAVVATPVLAQEAGTRGPGSRYGLEPRSFPRGAYNQLNGPSYATPRNGSNIENFGSSGRDPSRVGGQDPSFNPSST